MTKTISRRHRLLASFSHSADIGSVGRFSPRCQRWMTHGFLGKLVKIPFSPEVTGLEHIPQDRACLIVANHSAGLAFPETSGLAWLGANIKGLEGITVMSHPLGFHIPGINFLLKEFGIIPSTFNHAKEALAAGVKVMVFPGGDYESMRPLWQAAQTDFAGRKGFLKLAKEGWVPILPVTIQGSHRTVPILFRSKTLSWLLLLPRLLGVKWWSLTILGLIGTIFIVVFLGPSLGLGLTVALIILWLGGPFSFLPIVPSTIRYQISKPLEPDELFGEKSQPSNLVEYHKAYGMVTAAIRKGFT